MNDKIKKQKKHLKTGQILNGMIRKIVSLCLIGIAVTSLCACEEWLIISEPNLETQGQASFEEVSIPEYSGKPYEVINHNIPFFEESDLTTESFEHYSDLDELGRCGVAFANVGRDLMPTEKRGDISDVRPTGWKQKKYEGIVDSNPPYLYNRSHLIAYCLTAENANEFNLITGTHYMNYDGMRPFEEKVARYLDENDAHVLYRVTPIFDGDNLVANGVLMEAYSVEDNGRGICFCVYCYNVQPGIEIDYSTGASHLSSENADES